MSWTIPDKGEGANDLQSILFQEYLEVLVNGIDGGCCVLSGGLVTAQGAPNMSVQVAKAAVLSAGTLFAVAANTNLSIGAADATNPRIDLIVINSSGALAVRAGTPAAAPKPPNRTANDVVLSAIYIPANDTTIASNQITDLRLLRTQGPILLKKTTTPVTVSNNNTIQTLFTCTIPDGLFLAGKILRFRCGGSYLSNSGTPNWTFTISYGGTTMFADPTVNTVADTDRGAWTVEFDIVAQANNDQAMWGNISFQTPAAKTAATTGLGDISTTSHVRSPIGGSAAVDSNAANRDLLVRVTMSVANAAVETVMEGATLELL